MSPTSTIIVRALCALSLCASAAVAGDAHTTPTLNIHKLGDAIPGYPEGVVAFSPNSVRMGPGGWVLQAQVSHSIDVTTSELGLGPVTGQVLATGEVLESAFVHIDVSASGWIAQTGRLDDGRDVLVLGDQIGLVEGQPTAVPGIPGFYSWLSFRSIGFDAAGRLTVCGQVWSAGVPATLDLVFVRYSVNGSGELVAPHLLLHQGSAVGDLVVDELLAFADSSYGVTDDGRVAVAARLASVQPGGGEVDALILGDTLLAEDGTESVLPGRDWIISVGDPVTANAQGDVAFRTRVVGGAFPDFELVILVKNDQVLALQDAPVPGFPGSSLIFTTEPRLADDGRVAWGAEFEDAQGIKRQGFFVDDELVVLGVGADGDVSVASVIDGTWLSGPSHSSLHWDFEDNGDRLLFRGTNNVAGSWGIYTVDTKPWVSQGGGLVGSAAEPPLLVGGGDLAPGQPASLTTSGAPAFASAGLVIGLSELGLPFKGGTLCPNPDVLLTGLTTDGAGQLALAGTWPGGVPAGVSFWSQVWVADGAGPAGFAATNCLRAVTP